MISTTDVRKFIGRQGKTADQLFEKFGINMDASNTEEELSDMPRAHLFLTMWTMMTTGELHYNEKSELYFILDPV